MWFCNQNNEKTFTWKFGKVDTFWLCLGIVQILNKYIQAWYIGNFSQKGVLDQYYWSISFFGTWIIMVCHWAIGLIMLFVCFKGRNDLANRIHICRVPSVLTFPKAKNLLNNMGVYWKPRSGLRMYLLPLRNIIGTYLPCRQSIF